eukprot:TRINITY_DN4475_c0_g1_i1.p1 TRINITY_DN4475_c0_g1~~TRINITY_DN4475_c0_g1_i1.p1  ORF type:complete len:210 (-),score=41.52 TRINITY_DN4475_c0_g1_i1:369-998(-)
MIHRGFNKKKMGQAISKKKEKQKREPLMTQMKNKTTFSYILESILQISIFQDSSPSPRLKGRSSPSPPPRGLHSTLDSPTTTKEFLTFLNQMDKATMMDEEECGRAGSLEFVLKVRDLESAPDTHKESLMKQIGEKYFRQPGEGLVLDNNELWTRCADSCSEIRMTHQGIEHLKKAHDHCLAELDEMHLLFLQQRRDQSCVAQIISCLL